MVRPCSQDHARMNGYGRSGKTSLPRPRFHDPREIRAPISGSRCSSAICRSPAEHCNIGIALDLFSQAMSGMQADATEQVDAVLKHAKNTTGKEIGKQSGGKRTGQRSLETQINSCSRYLGGVAEWLKAPVLKTGRRETVSWVRIPPPPPSMTGSCEVLLRRFNDRFADDAGFQQALWLRSEELGFAPSAISSV